MKKQLFLLLSALILAVSPSFAYDFSAVAPSGQTLYYNISGTNATVTYPGSSSIYLWSGFTTPTGDLTIPASVTYNGQSYSVTSIGSYTFCDCSSLFSVTIPTSVTSIGNSAFSGCSGLTTLTIPNPVTSIGNSAFSGCSGLTTLTIPNSVTSIGSSAFSGCSGLSSLTIPNSVTSIGSYTFRNCSGLASVTIPSSVTSIGREAFSGCSGLTTLTVPNSVTTIGISAFYGIKVVNYCGSASGSPWGAHYAGCCFYEEGDFIYQNNTKTTLIAYIGSDSIISIPNSVTSIGYYAFFGCSGITSVTIPNSVTYIGSFAFYDCSGLTSVTIPNSVTSIGDYAFYDCSSLTSVTIGNSVTFIGSSAFEDCRSITSVSIGSSVASIGNNAFDDCNSLNSVTIPTSVTTIGNYAFRGVKVVNYCGSAQGSPWGAYYAGCCFCEGDFIYQDNTKTTLLSYAGSDISITIPASVTTIGNYAFYGYNGLTSLTIPNSVTSIGSSAFSSCSGLTSVSIGSSVITIGDFAFSGCRGLTSLTIPNSVTSIGSSAFSSCSGLTSLSIGSSVTTIGDYAFSGCSNVDTLYYNAKNCSNSSFSTSYDSGFWPMKDSLSVLIMGDSVQTIPSYAFSHCSGLTSLTISNSVTSIGNAAFYSCSGLTSLTIPNSVTSIGNSAFYGCSGLTSVSIGCSLSLIVGYAFYGCSNVDTLYYNAKNCSNSSFSTYYDSYGFRPMKNSLSVLIIGDSVQSIPSAAFYGCSGLTSVIIPNSVDTIGSQAFYGCNNIDTVFAFREIPATLGQNSFPSTSISIVPCTSVTLYENAGWPNVQSLEVIPNYVFISNIAHGIVSDMMVPFCPLRAVTFEAIPNYGYHFTQWSDDNTDNPRTITLTQDTSFTALFDSNTYTITVVSSDEDMGNVVGTTSQKYLTTASISATPNEGYYFVSWNDCSTLNPRAITVSQDSFFTAIFASLVDTVAMCPDAFPFTYGDTIFNTNTQEGDYPVHFSTIQGCDSIVTLTLQFLPTYRHNDSLTLCYSMMPYNYGGYILNTDLETGNHDIPLRSALGCDSTIALNLTVHASENTQLCMVSVENELNTLRWNKEVPVEYYKIYREGFSAGEYDLLDSIPSSASSSWVDQESNPRARSYRYRISSVDSCGNESELSNVHKTMHLTISRGLNNSWNLVWTEYEGASYSTYKIYCGTNPSDLTEIDVIPAGGNTTYTDENAPSSGNVYYQVGIVLNQPCNDAKAAELVLSNQASNSTGDINSAILSGAIITANSSQIVVSNAANQRIRIFDNIGRLISTTLNTEETSIFNMPASGVYLVQVGNAPAQRVVVVK